MRTLSLIFLVSLLLTSCSGLDGESYSSFTGYVDINEVGIPDSVPAGQEVPISVQAVAPNGCWSNLVVSMGKSMYVDTIYAISATGSYVSVNNMCAQIQVVRDTTLTFKADSAGTFIFVSYSAYRQTRVDTLVVTDTASRRYKHISGV